LSPTPPISRGSATSAITLLALASFASQSMVRVSDSLLPQIAADMGVSVGAASIVVTAYALAHGSVQLIIGPVGDRFGKYACVTAAAAMSTVLVLLCGLADSLPTLVAARLACGLSAGWIIPLAMAFLGDVIPYERRQQVLGTFLSGQILGQLFGQAAGGRRRSRRLLRMAPGVLFSSGALRGRDHCASDRILPQSDHACRPRHRHALARLCH
jgi:predicted MFS family arabinose efflux permease